MADVLVLLLVAPGVVLFSGFVVDVVLLAGPAAVGVVEAVAVARVVVACLHLATGVHVLVGVALGAALVVGIRPVLVAAGVHALVGDVPSSSSSLGHVGDLLVQVGVVENAGGVRSRKRMAQICEDRRASLA